MEKRKIVVQTLSEDVKLPEYIDNDHIFFFRISSFKKLYKGSKEINLKNELQHSIREGRILLRPFERILVGTSLIFTLPPELRLNITSKDTLAIVQGISLITHYFETNGELCLLLYNGSQFLSEVNIGVIAAKGSFSPQENIEFVSN